MARTSNSAACGYIIISILVLAMLVKCTTPETQAQMESDIAGLTQEQRDAAIAPMQHGLYPGRMP